MEILPQKIVLIRGIHPNELDLTPEIATELRRQGHKVKVVKIPFRKTIHGHSRFGKRRVPYSSFEGKKFVEKIGFTHPSWHVFGIHSSPKEKIPNVRLLSEDVLLNRGNCKELHKVGHFYLDSLGTSHNPVFVENGHFYYGSRARCSLEIPAVYDEQPAIPIDLSKFHLPRSRGVAAFIREGYERRTSKEKTFTWCSKTELVRAAVRAINNEVGQSKKGLEAYAIAEMAGYARRAIKNKHSEYVNGSPGYRKLLKYTSRYAWRKKQQ